MSFGLLAELRTLSFGLSDLPEVAQAAPALSFGLFDFIQFVALDDAARIRQHTSAYVSIRQQALPAHKLVVLKYYETCCPPDVFQWRLCRRGNAAYRPHTSAYVSMRQHTSAYVSIRQHTSAYVSIRQHTSACVRICQHTSAYVSIRQNTSAYVSIRQHTSAYVSMRQHTAAYGSIRQHTSGCVRMH